MKFDVNLIMEQLKKLGDEQIKQIYLRHGAKEPLYGITTGKLKVVAKKLSKNYELSMKLYSTGNYDAMYLAGIIAEPMKMTKLDFETWIEKAYCHGIADYIVAVTLAKSPMAQEIASKWIQTDNELYTSAGWSCYSYLIGYQPDDNFDKEKLQNYLKEIEQTIHSKPNRVRYSMNNFVISVGISYMPLHAEALTVAKKIGKILVDMGDTNCKTPVAFESIQKAIDQKRIGFKRKYIQC